MNFHELIKAWRGANLLRQAMDEFVEMLETCHWMYERAATSLGEETDVVEYKRSVREKDIQVNKMERRIRKRIIEHLAIHPGSGTSQSLVLMSVVKDAERLGDYAKNMVEVSEYHTTYKDDNDLIPLFKGIQAEIEEMFRRVGRAFRDSDEKEGHKIISDMTLVTRKCDRLVEKILDFQDLTVRQAVCYALLARYYKRFAAHLGNIGTSLVVPAHKLDYFDENEEDRKG
jgi:phosphate transport system protein